MKILAQYRALRTAVKVERLVQMLNDGRHLQVAEELGIDVSNLSTEEFGQVLQVRFAELQARITPGLFPQIKAQK